MWHVYNARKNKRPGAHVKSNDAPIDTTVIKCIRQIRVRTRKHQVRFAIRYVRRVYRRERVVNARDSRRIVVNDRRRTHTQSTYAARRWLTKKNLRPKVKRVGTQKRKLAIYSTRRGHHLNAQRRHVYSKCVSTFVVFLFKTETVRTTEMCRETKKRFRHCGRIV